MVKKIKKENKKMVLKKRWSVKSAPLEIAAIAIFQEDKEDCLLLTGTKRKAYAPSAAFVFCAKLSSGIFHPRVFHFFLFFYPIFYAVTVQVKIGTNHQAKCIIRTYLVSDSKIRHFTPATARIHFV